MVLLLRLQFIPTDTINIRQEVSDKLLHRHEPASQFLAHHVFVVPLAALFVVTHQALTGTPVVQTVFQPMRTLRVGRGKLPDGHFDN
jgi:hypothetical protein